MYKGEFYSLEGKHYVVTITDNSDQDKALIFEGTPIVIERKGDDDGIFSPIISTNCTLSLYCTSDYQYTSLATDDYPHVVTVVCDMRVLFVGPIEKGLHREAYEQPPFVTEVVAGCGIKNLQNWTPHFPTLTNEFRGEKRITLKELIEGCLVVAGDHMKPQFDTSKLEYWQDDLDATFDAREWLYDGDIRDTATAYDILSDILTTMGARMYQHGGKWYIDRPGDLLQRSHTEIQVDNKDIYFIDSANTSISKACGAMEITMPMKAKKNLIASRIDAVNDPNGWRIENTGGQITRAQVDGFDVHITARKEGKDIKGVTCRYKLPITALLNDIRNFNQIRISAKIYSPKTNETDRTNAVIIMYPIISNETGTVTFVAMPDGDGGSHKMIKDNEKNFLAHTGDPIVSNFGNLQRKGGAPVQRNCSFDKDELLANGAKYIELIYVIAYNAHGEGNKIKVDKLTPIEEIELGEVSLTFGREFEEEEGSENELKAYVQCQEADESLAEEIDLGFAVGGPLHTPGAMVSRVLMKGGQPLSVIRKRGASVGVDPLGLVARDRALQNSYKREVIDATLNTARLYAPHDILKVTTQGKTYLATSQRADLMNDSNEITLTELVNDTVKIIARE